MRERSRIWVIFMICAACLTAAAQTTLTIESPEPNAVFPQFSSPTLRVRVENGDGTLRWFVNDPVDSLDMLLFTNVGPTATFEVHLTNLPPGNYKIPVMTRLANGDFLTNNTIDFTVLYGQRMQPRYTMTILPGGTNTAATRINNKGQVIGVSAGRAFLYDGEMHFLGSLGGAHSEATGINNRGEVVGVSEDATGARRAFIWSSEAGMQPLPVNGVPADINDDGDIVGNGEQGAFLYRNGTIVPLPGVAMDINNRGVVALGEGGAQKTRGEPMWNEFARLLRPMVYGEDPPHVSAIAINDANEVVGHQQSSVGGGRYWSVCSFHYSAFRRDGCPRGNLGYAWSINLLGDVVGSDASVTYGPRGIVQSITPSWAYMGSSRLNDVIRDRGGLDVTNAVSINDRREIVGTAKNNDGSVSVLLRPIPQFQTIEVDPAAGKIHAVIDGLIDTRVRIEKSENLKDWEFHSALELVDGPVEISLPLESADGSAFLRMTRD